MLFGAYLEGGGLEVRRRSGGGVRLAGRFPYRKTAVLSDGGRTGRPRKEVFEPRAFAFRVEDPTKEIHLLVGHDYNRPLASKLTGTLALTDSDDALTFTADVAEEIAQTSYGKDAIAQIGAGLAFGISPGFRVPPERQRPATQRHVAPGEHVGARVLERRPGDDRQLIQQRLAHMPDQSAPPRISVFVKRAVIRLLFDELRFGHGALRGEALFLITDRGLVPAADWDLSTRDGQPRAYRMSVSEAGGGRTMTALAAEVLHLRIGCDPVAPWLGTAPLRRATLTASMLHAVESALAEVFENAP